MGSERYRGGLVSADARIALIVCQLRSDAQSEAIVQRLLEAAAACHVTAKLHFGGTPFMARELNVMIVHDLKVLLPVVSLLIILTLFVAFGTIRGVLVPLGSVLMSTVWVVGLMGLLKVPLTLVSDIIPALLVAVGTAPCIHILSKFDEDVRRYGSQGEDAQTAFREVGIRVILAALTIVLGFSSFIVGSYLTTIRDFGIFASVGVLFSLLISILFVPALLGSLRISPPRSTARKGRLIPRLLAAWAGVLVRRRRLIIIVSIAILVVGLARHSPDQARVGVHELLRLEKPDPVDGSAHPEGIRRVPPPTNRFPGRPAESFRSQGDAQIREVHRGDSPREQPSLRGGPYRGDERAHRQQESRAG